MATISKSPAAALATFEPILCEVADSIGVSA